MSTEKYPFEDEAGKLVLVPLTREAACSDRYEIGEWVTVRRQRLRRMPLSRMHSGPGLEVSVQPNFEITGYAMSNSHPALDGLGLARDRDNNPLFQGKRDIERFDLASRRLHEKDPTVPIHEWDQK